jgi:hypothetical protein
MRPKRSDCRGGKWRITPAASMRCRAPSCWRARAGKWSARPRRKGAAGRVNWPRRKVAPEQRPTHPYVAPHTAKIHTPITLEIRHRAKLLVFKPRRRRPCGFDSHRPLRSRTTSDNPGQLAQADTGDCLGRCWDSVSISSQFRCLRLSSSQISGERSVAQADRHKEPSARVIVTAVCGLKRCVRKSGHTRASALRGTLFLRNAAN